jgi:hypothetical protein
MESGKYNGHIIQVIEQSSGTNSTCMVPDISVRQISDANTLLATICAITMLIKALRLLIESGKK